MKVFLAGPFKNKIKDGKIEEGYKELLLNIKRVLNDLGYDVHLALERECWGAEFWTDEECTKRDYQEIKESDAVIALFDETFSGGVHVELGWASEMKKKIIIITNKKDNLCSLIKGMGTISKCNFIEFDNIEEIFQKLKQEVSRWKN